VSCDGGFIVSGICVLCGQEFSTEDTFPVMTARAAVADYLRYRASNQDDILEDFKPKGKPS